MISSKFQNGVRPEDQGLEMTVNERASAGLMRRSQFEIRMDMLRAVKGGAEGPTQIMYKANLSWITLQQHLRNLVNSGCLRQEENGNRMRYELTQKGFNIMVAYEGLIHEVDGQGTGDLGYGTAAMHSNFR